MGFLDKLLMKKEIKKTTSETFDSYVKGALIPIGDVSDPTFAEEMIGKSVAIMPTGNVLRAPANGTMQVVFDTKHAVALETECGAELLLHIGIDTVKLHGEHFTSRVNVGDKVKKGDILVEFDREAIEKKGYDTVVVMVVTNSDTFSSIEPMLPGKVSEKDVIMNISK